ncbi:ATP-dependent DNA ligase [Cellulomonas sp. ICMP 17802]|uniref:ATP-dependent DNA ligase n=1 Tax=Cellulomonas sp. ICMP 17802 TaxID=3239199 RepID=UPI00351B01B2
MLFADLATTSSALATSRSRLAKRALLVDLLRRTPPQDVGVVSRYLGGQLRQRRTGLGWRSLSSLPLPAAEPSLTVAEVDAAFEAMSLLSGPGSGAARSTQAAALFGAATPDEQRLLRGLVTGELRQGSLDALLLDAVAEAAGVPPEIVRRAAMLAGDTEPVAVAALTTPDPAAALAGFSLVVGRPVRPMLAQSAPDVDGAWASLAPGPVVVDSKLDGIRIQVHRQGPEVRVFTRSLDEITGRVPEIVARVLDMPATDLVLDGEALALGPDGRPRPFQETASRSATRDADVAAAVTLTPFFFDCLHVDGTDLLDEPLLRRLEALDAVAGPSVVDRLVTSDAPAARDYFAGAVRAGQEGVVVKAAGAPYEAGRRGAAWIKVKPRNTLDLVVLAVEWGSGRRQGLLSNIHLGARDGDGFVMLGKTFKGMTDEMLRWQTERFTALADGPTDGYVVHLRPEQVVEIAFDGLQRSSRYPGGLALRFARVVRYRDDKPAAEADTIDTVRALAG